MFSSVKDIKQLVASPTADPGVVSLIPAQSHTFVEIDCKVLVNRLVKLVLEEVWLGELTVLT